MKTPLKRFHHLFSEISLKCESMWDGPTLTIRIRHSSNGKFIASFREKGGYDNANRRSSRIISADFVSEIMTSLRKVKIVPFPEMLPVCDGAITTLTIIGNLNGSASFRWWAPSKKWDPLVEIAGKIWRLFLKE